ncbi:MAG: type I restriction endonuclease subunit R [Fibrobacteria bacterium]|nr:type I restriction endonuclease subunit R [Fibrobacteria bacterium]
MTDRLRPERLTQDRVIRLFTESTQPGHLGYRYLGDLHNDSNRCVDTKLLKENLLGRGYDNAQISAALLRLQSAIETTGVTPYQANMRTYQLLRYGIPVQTTVERPHDTVHLIDWDHPERNDFALAEEVTLRGKYDRRPDIVLYINGLAVVVLELKRASVDLADGIRQLVTNQEEIFHQEFFSTVQLVLSGSDSQGLRYATTGSPEQFFVEWKAEPATSSEHRPQGALLDAPLAAMCNKATLLDLIRNFVIFDAGRKKVPRQHQYQAIKAGQTRIAKREGGVIWHTQGSGKSILMVLLAKWLVEHDPDARILIVTDRDELDKQITGVMRNTGVVGAESGSPRISSRSEFMQKIGDSTPQILCALLHKIDPSDLEGPPPRIHGSFYVFVDECHRTQGGDMNRQLKRWFQGAIFVGFTGTPLLRKDKTTTRDVFGTYIHTYKFHQAVADKVVLDLKYEPRDVPQRTTSPTMIDRWFEQKTRNLNNFQKALVRKRWATLEELMSSAERKQRIIASIIDDFGIRTRLNSDRGTALLVAASIYDACHYFRLFQNTSFGRHCGIVTSFEPNHNDISREPSNSDARYKFDTYTKHVLRKGQTTAQYEEQVKKQFIEEPAQMKLLIVVSKLLTGFDAPSCTYIYLDNELRDHNLFQAICRTNRLDGPDKDYGYIVDFKKLFEMVEQAIAVYSSDELDIDDENVPEECNVHLKDWVTEGRIKLDESREALRYLCEPVLLPQELEQYLQYFCGDAADPSALANTEPLRISYYKTVSNFVRAFADLLQNLSEAGYSDGQIVDLQREVDFHVEIRSAIKKHSGEELDIKPYEADMRHLINTYVLADPAQALGGLEELPLTDLIIKTGIHDAIARKLNAKNKLSRKSVAEAIINNIRKTIIRDQLTDPRFYDRMSKLLEDLIRQSRLDTATYEQFLRDAEALVRQLAAKEQAAGLPPLLLGNPQAITLFNNLPGILDPSRLEAAEPSPEEIECFANLALTLDRTVREHALAGWRGDSTRESALRNELYKVLDKNREATLSIFEIIKNQPGY